MTRWAALAGTRERAVRPIEADEAELAHPGDQGAHLGRKGDDPGPRLREQLGVEALVAGDEAGDNHRPACGEGLAHGEPARLADHDVCFGDAGGHVLLEAEDPGAHPVLLGNRADPPREPFGLAAHDRELHVSHALERPHHLADGPDPEAAARDQHAKRLARGRIAHRRDGVEGGSHGDARDDDAPDGKPVLRDVGCGASHRDAERVEALLRPHGVGSVVGDDAHERGVQTPLASRATEDDQGQVMRGDDGARVELHDVLHQPGPRHVVDRASHGLERAVAAVGGRVRGAVESRDAALRGEVRPQVRLPQHTRGVLEGVQHDDGEPASARGLGDGERRSLVSATDGGVNDDEIGSHGRPG